MKYDELTVLIPGHCLEDLPTELPEKQAASLLNAFCVLWHPSLIASTGAFPRYQRADTPAVGQQNRLVIVPLSAADLVPEGWLEQVRSEGTVVISGEHERTAMIQQALAPLALDEMPDPDLAADFLALGSLYLHTELLTRRMRNYSNLDEAHLQRELTAAARAAVNHDPDAARKHLGYCFEMLLECRERFYPVDCYLIDLCLVSPDLAGEAFMRLLESPVPVNVLAPARDWQALGDLDPQWAERLKQAAQRGTLEFVGGDDEELCSTLMSLDSTLWHLRSGRKVIEDLFASRPVTWGRKRFGLGPHLPQILDRLGYCGALHLLLDDGLYPDEEQSHLRWEGVNGTCIDAFSRIPLAADSASGLLRFADRMSESMDYDHTAAVVLARWPDMRTPFLDDFRRAARYAPVFGKFVRFADFFAQATSPGRLSDFKSSAYLSPSLVRSVAQQEVDPISRYVQYWERQRAFERADWAAGVARLLANSPETQVWPDSLEGAVHAAHPEADQETQLAADDAIAVTLAMASESLSEILTTSGQPGPGVLIVNPLSFPRRALMEWPAGSVPPRDPRVLNRQIEGDRSWALVELPPAGFVWLPAETHPSDNTAPGKLPLAEELVLRNDLFEVELSDVTGGIGQVKTYRRSPNRISQQVALRFPAEKTVTVGTGEEQTTFQTYYTAMLLRESRIVNAGPLIGEIETQGDLQDEQTGELLGTYRQRTRVIRGRPVIQVQVEVNPAQEITGNPWTSYIGCRFAWRHIDVAVTASQQQGAHPAPRERIEAPHFIEIADDDFRTTILSPGLTFHRLTGERMLDTLLLTAGESARQFRFAIAIDAKYPMQACLDEFSPPLVIPTQTRPAEGGQTGWFFSVSAANVLLTRVLPSATPGSVIVRLLETEGRARVLGLQCFRTPRQARQVNFNGETICTLRIDDAVNVEISPYEICDVELTF